MKNNENIVDGEKIIYKPTMDSDYVDTAPLRVLMPKGWKPGECWNCFFKPLGSRCKNMRKEFCPIKVAK